MEENRDTPSATAAGQPVMALLVEPRSKKKKKKKKDNLLSRMIARVALGSAAGMQQMGDALRDAADKYRRKHRKSRDKKRNGATRDLGKNLASATTELLAGSAKVPTKMAKALWKKDKKKKKKDRDGDEIRTVLVQPIAQPDVTAPPVVS